MHGKTRKLETVERVAIRMCSATTANGNQTAKHKHKQAALWWKTNIWSLGCVGNRHCHNIRQYECCISFFIWPIFIICICIGLQRSNNNSGERVWEDAGRKCRPHRSEIQRDSSIKTYVYLVFAKRADGHKHCHRHRRPSAFRYPLPSAMRDV